MTCKATKYFVCIYDVFLCVAGCISCISRCCSWYLGVVPGTSVLFRVPRVHPRVPRGHPSVSQGIPGYLVYI